jgi:hypothetical protein
MLNRGKRHERDWLTLRKLRVFLAIVLAFLFIQNQQWSFPDYTVSKEDEEDDDRPRNLRLAFVGDSLTRYMYLSLGYYLKHGEWAPRGHQLLEKVKDPDPNAWNDWLAYSNDELQPHEDCDCYRYWTHPFKWYRHCENRYFRDEDRGNYVTFITKFGGNPFHGHWNASTVFSKQQRHERNTTIRSYNWWYPSWADLTDQYISQLSSKPDYMIFNQGHWRAHELRDRAVLDSLKTSLTKAGIIGIYRTTYFPCLNVSWTAWTPPEDYVDDVHFKADINNRMSQQLLEFLKEHQLNSVKT